MVPLKYLGLEDEKNMREWVSALVPLCDGFFYRKKTVAVVGVEILPAREAVYLAGLAAKVYLIVRKPLSRFQDYAGACDEA